MRNEKIMSYKMKALMYFKSTMIQTDSEKILCVQKIPSKRFFGRWKISVGTLFEISKVWKNSEKHKSFLCMYQKNNYNCTHAKNYKKYIPQKIVPIVPTQNITKST